MKKLLALILFGIFSIMSHAELPPKLFGNTPGMNFYFIPMAGYSNQYVVFRNGIAKAAVSVKFKGTLAGQETMLMVDANCSNGTMKIFETNQGGIRDTSFQKPKDETFGNILKSICNEV